MECRVEVRWCQCECTMLGGPQDICASQEHVIRRIVRDSYRLATVAINQHIAVGIIGRRTETELWRCIGILVDGVITGFVHSEYRTVSILEWVDNRKSKVC